MRPWAAVLVLACLFAGFLATPALAGDDEEKGPWLKTKYGVSFYGYIKVDTVYDDSNVNVGNFARWVDSEYMNPDDSQFNMTANQTRLGLKLNTGDRYKIITRARVEVDFYGDAPAQNKPALLLRHAYLELEWPKARVRLLAGQTTDIISPLVPPTINYTVGWWAGNIGYRRPQIRYTQQFGDDIGYRSTLALGITRNIGHDGPYDVGDTGEADGGPVAAGRFAVIGPMAAGRTGSVGISGHYGTEEYDLDQYGGGVNLESWSLNVDLTLPLAEWLTLKAEAFFGTNLDAYLGGIAQGITVPDDGEPYEIDATGAWFNIGMNPGPKLDVNAGASIDDPDDEQLLPGDRSKNTTFYGNMWWNFTKATKLGFEVSQWDTAYLDEPNADAMRYQTSFVFSF